MQRGLLTFVLFDHLQRVVWMGGWVVVAMLLDVVMEDDDIVRRRDTMKTPTPTSSPLSLFQRVRTETRSVREL